MINKFKIKDLSLQKILSNSMIVLSGNIGANIFGLISVSLFTHSVGAEAFGYYILFFTFIEIIDKIFNFQTSQAFMKFASDFQAKDEHYNVMMLLKYSFFVDFISLLFAYLITLYSIDIFMSFFTIPIEYTNLIIIMATSTLFKVSEISSGIFRLFDEFKIQSKILVYISILKVILFGIIVLIDPFFDNFIYATVFAQFISFVMKIIISKKILNKNNYLVQDIIGCKIDHSLLKKLKIMHFLMYKNFSVAIRMVSRQLDVIILGKLLGAEVVAIYKIAKDVTGLVSKVTDPIYQAIYPEFAKLLANNQNKKAQKVALKISFFAGLSGLFSYTIFIIIGKWFIVMMFGDPFLSSYGVALVYYIAILISIIGLPLVPLMDSSGLVRYTFTNQLYATILYILIIYPLINLYGMYGAAIAYVVYYAFWSLLALNRINKNNLKLNKKGIK